jgi:hypothetical protein
VVSSFTDYHVNHKTAHVLLDVEVLYFCKEIWTSQITVIFGKTKHIKKVSASEKSNIIGFLYSFSPLETCRWSSQQMFRSESCGKRMGESRSFCRFEHLDVTLVETFVLFFFLIIILSIASTSFIMKVRRGYHTFKIVNVF